MKTSYGAARGIAPALCLAMSMTTSFLANAETNKQPEPKPLTAHIAISDDRLYADDRVVIEITLKNTSGVDQWCYNPNFNSLLSVKAASLWVLDKNGKRHVDALDKTRGSSLSPTVSHWVNLPAGSVTKCQIKMLARKLVDTGLSDNLLPSGKYALRLDIHAGMLTPPPGKDEDDDKVATAAMRKWEKSLPGEIVVTSNVVAFEFGLPVVAAK